MAFTYNAGGMDTLSQIRFAISDTQETGALFEDAELLGVFAMPEAAANVQLAGAYALESLAADSARLAVLTKKGTRGNDERSIYAALLATAARLRARAVVAPAVVGPEPLFSIGSSDGSIIGTMDIW